MEFAVEVDGELWVWPEGPPIGELRALSSSSKTERGSFDARDGANRDWVTVPEEEADKPDTIDKPDTDASELKVSPETALGNGKNGSVGGAPADPMTFGLPLAPLALPLRLGTDSDSLSPPAPRGALVNFFDFFGSGICLMLPLSPGVGARLVGWEIGESEAIASGVGSHGSDGFCAGIWRRESGLEALCKLGPRGERESGYI